MKELSGRRVSVRRRAAIPVSAPLCVMRCAEVLKRGGGEEAEEDISTRIESIPGRNRNNTHLEKVLNLEDITNFFFF